MQGGMEGGGRGGLSRIVESQRGQGERREGGGGWGGGGGGGGAAVGKDDEGRAPVQALPWVGPMLGRARGGGGGGGGDSRELEGAFGGFAGSRF